MVGFLNKSSCKRLCVAAGVKRESIEIHEILSSFLYKYLQLLLKRLILLVKYNEKKTVSISDVVFISKICKDYKTLIIPIQNEYTILTTFILKNSFRQLINNIVKEQTKNEDYNIRFEKNVPILLQYLSEQYIIQYIKTCYKFTVMSKRDTLLSRDLLQF